MAQIIEGIVTTREQRVAKQIDQLITMAAQAQKRAYYGVRQLVYAHPQFRKSVPVEGQEGKTTQAPDPDAVFAAFQANTKTALTAAQLGQMARIAKASLNMFQAGAIVDDVPEASITFPAS